MALIILGLDGMNLNLFNYCQKDMPNLSSLLEKSAYGKVKSIYPPLSGPAWITMFTGKNIGSHGFLNSFYYAQDMKLKLNNPDGIKDEHFYETLFKLGKKIFLMDVPFSSPRIIKGDFLDYCFSVRDEERMIIPAELTKRFPSINHFINYKKKLEDLDEIINYNGNIIKEVIRAKEHDLMFFQLSLLDWVQHKELINLKLNHNKKSTQLTRKIIRKVDSLLGWIIDHLGSNDHFMIVSDHGLGVYQNTFFPNTWLKKEGYIKIKSKKEGLEKESFKNSLVRYLTYIAKSNQNFLNFTKKVHKLFRKSLGKDVNPHLSIDHINSSAACLIKNTPLIKILESNKLKKEEIKKEITEKLEHKLGFKAIDILFFYECSDKIIAQKLLSFGDLVVDCRDHRLDISFGSKIILKGENIFHDENAIFLIYGKNVKNMKVESVSLSDIAPTILYLFGFQPPGGIDGKILDVFKEPIKTNKLNSENQQKEIVKSLNTSPDSLDMISNLEL